MKEQSHKEEMSAALRGDFQRLRDRGVATSLTPASAESGSAEPGSGSSQSPEIQTEAPAEVEVPSAESEEPGSGSSQSPEVQRAELPEVEALSEPERQGWLGRVLGR